MAVHTKGFDRPAEQLNSAGQPGIPVEELEVPLSVRHGRIDSMPAKRDSLICFQVSLIEHRDPSGKQVNDRPENPLRTRIDSCQVNLPKTTGHLAEKSSDELSVDVLKI